MKNLKKVFAVIMALAMIFALSVTAFAATTVSTTEDTSVLSVTSTGNTVTYQAVTVDGGIKDGVSYPSTTVYSYCIKTSSNTATVQFSNPQGYKLYLDNVYVSNSTSYTDYLDKNYHYSLVLKNATGTVIRSFDISVVDTSSVHITIEINCYNANNWLKTHTNSAVTNAMTALTSDLSLNDIGKMTTVISLDLPSGSTAMDALYAVMDLKGLTLSGTGSTSGTGNHPTIYTYISSIDGLGEFMCGSWSGWCYVKAANNNDHYTMPMVGAASYTLTQNEHIIWVYTCDYSDIGTAINATA